MRRREISLLLVALIGMAALVVFVLQSKIGTSSSTPLGIDAPLEHATHADTVLDTAAESPARVVAAEDSTDASPRFVERAALIVSIVSDESRAPLPDATVSIFDPSASEPTPQVLTSDGEGRAEFDVESGIDLVVTASASDGGQSLLDVAALAPAERRSVSIAVKSGDGSRLFGIVQHCDRGTPIAGATVTLCRAVSAVVAVGDALYREVRLQRVTTGADGRFEFAYPMWARAYLWIHAPGWGPVVSEIRADGGTFEKSQVVCVEPSAALDVVLTDGRGLAIPDASVGLAARASRIKSAQRNPHFAIEHLPEIQWRRTTDGRGRCRFDGMPAVVPLVAFAELADQPRSRNEREVFLRAGESNELRWTMESFGALRGRIVDRDGNAVKGRLILLAAAQDREPCPLSQSGYYEDQVMSDGLGRFSFDRVAPGRWWVGPVRHVPCGHDCFVGLPIEVRIADASLDSDVLLVDQPGLSIRGRIVDGDGTSASGRVTAVDVAHGCELSAQAERDGAFLLSPLLPGNYRVQGSRLQRQAHTEPVVVAAGTDDVRLTLPAGGSLHGRVLGARDEPRTDASVFARRRGPDETRAAVIGESTRIFILASGDFRVRGVEPGTYDVWATTSEGLFDLVADVDVRAGSELSALSLSMSPGARLRLRCDDESSAGAFEVRAGGVLLYAGELRVGFTQPLVVPAGPVDIAHTARGGARRTRTVEIVAGEDRFVVSGKDF